MRPLATLLLCCMFMTGRAQERRAMAMSVDDFPHIHVKHSEANFDVELSTTEPGKVIVKVIDSSGTIMLRSSSSSSDNKDNQVTEIIFDTQHKTTLINGIEHP